MTDKEFRNQMVQHRRKKRDKTLKAIIILLCALGVINTGFLVGLIYLIWG